jgi:hypothetical protein
MALPPVETLFREELDPSLIETYDVENGLTAKRRYKMAWGARFDFVNGALGVFDNIPDIYPFTIPPLTLIATNAEIEPFGKVHALDAITVDYDYAIVELTYTIPEQPLTVLDEVIDRSEAFTASSQTISFPNTGLFWGDDSEVPAESAPQKIIQLATWTFTAENQIFIHPDVYGLKDYVNEFNVIANRLGIVFAPRTLMYQSYNISVEPARAGENRLKIDFVFLFKADGWYNFYKSADEDAQPIYKATGATNQYIPYREADFINLVNYNV